MSVRTRMPPPRSFHHLNLLRGVAALAVFSGHLRDFFVVDYAHASHVGPLGSALYLATGYGHEGVVLFFVLSGYVIAANVLPPLRAGSWSWTDYATNRLTRLYAVLLPGLVLCAVWDRVGLGWLDPVVYHGGGDGPGELSPDRLTVSAFVGNLAFLQTILVPSFGSNTPLWSLANEFWYYVVFPGLCAPLFGWSKTLWAIGAIVLVAIGIGNPDIPLYLSIWLLGVAVFEAPRLRVRPRLGRLVPLALLAFAGTLVLARTRALGTFASDSVVALGAATLIYTLLHDDERTPPDGYATLATALAGCSFTLYVSHVPVILFARSLLLRGPARLMPSWSAGLGVTAVGVVIFAYAYGLARVTEARTPELRRAARRLLATRGS